MLLLLSGPRGPDPIGDTAASLMNATSDGQPSSLTAPALHRYAHMISPASEP